MIQSNSENQRTIYKMTSPRGLVYVGACNGEYDRLQRHLYFMKRGWVSKKLKTEWDACGKTKEGWTIEELETTTVDKAGYLENYYIDKLNTIGDGLNSYKSGYGNWVKRSKETRQKISDYWTKLREEKGVK